MARKREGAIKGVGEEEGSIWFKGLGRYAPFTFKSDTSLALGI